MRLLKALGIVLLAFSIVGLMMLSCYLFEWVAFWVLIGIIFVVSVVGVYLQD